MKLKKGLPCGLWRRALSVLLAVLMMAAGGTFAQAVSAEALQAAIDSLPVDQGGYTSLTWDALQLKKIEAQTLADNEAATDAEREDMLGELNAAYNALADGGPLQLLVYDMPTNQWVYSTASFHAMLPIRGQAQDLLNSGTGTKEQIAAMYQKAEEALHALVSVQPITAAEHYYLPTLKNNYTTASWNKLLAARDLAAYYVEHAMSEAEVLAAVSALEKAWDEIVDSLPLVSVLNRVGASLPAQGISMSDVTRTALLELEETHRALLETATEQAQIDAAAAEIEAAIAALIDIGVLKSLIQRLPLSQETYTTATWNALQTAQALAEDTIANATSNEEVTAAQIALDRANNRLVDAAPLFEILATLPQQQGLLTDESWLALQEARTAAELAIQNATSESQVRAASDALSQTQEALATESVVSHTPASLTLHRKTAYSTFSNMDSNRITWYSSNPNLLRIDEETGAIRKDSYRFASIGQVTITAKIGDTVVRTFDVNVTWAWWQWILVVVGLGWIYL